MIDLQAEEVPDLRAGDDQRDAVGEPHDNGPRDEAHRGAKPEQPRGRQQDARHHRAHEQAVHAVARHDASHDYDERAGGPADLELRSPSAEIEKSGDDGAVDAGLG